MMSDERGVNEFLGALEAPEDVIPVRRLLNDLVALEFLLKGSVP